jgi:putative transposase
MQPYREFYRRHLPHWQPIGAILFITFRLKGSLPYEVIETLREERNLQKQNLAKLSESERTRQDYLDDRRYFVRWNDVLDKSETGPCWLGQAEIAKIVKEAFHYRDGREYELFTYCIMTNHVRVVFKPGKSDCQSDLPSSEYHSDLQQSDSQLSKILQSLKRHTARQSNLVLGRQGAFWQDESYDHVIRDNGEFERIIHYVLQNPVKAGLVSQWEDWPWSYCRLE